MCIRDSVITVAIAAAVLVIGAIVLTATGRGRSQVLAGDMISRKGESVGWVEVGAVAGNPVAGNAGADTVRVSLPAWAYSGNGDRNYHLQVEWANGGTRDLGEFTVGPGRETWSAPLGGDVDDVRTIAVTNDDGVVVCHAELG